MSPVSPDLLPTVVAAASDLDDLVKTNANQRRLAIGATVLTTIGVLSRWTSDDVVTLNGLEGPHNGWVILVYTAIAAACIQAVARLSPPAIVCTILAGALNLWTLLGTHSVPGVSLRWGYWLTLLGALGTIGAGIWAIRLRSAAPLPLLGRPSRRFKYLPRASSVGIGASIIAYVLLRQVIFVGENASWPPQPDAITAHGAQAAVEAFAAGNPGPHDVGLDYAWTTAATIEPWPGGDVFYPLLLDDVANADSSIHILMFGWKEGDIGAELTDLLIGKLQEGVEVRILVDSLGSGPFGASKDMYDKLVDAGAQVVANDTLPIDGDGLLPDRSIDWSHDELGHADHRKLYVFDGEVAWTGGAGIEDHFRNGEFHDVMVRYTGDIVLQSQAVFLTSFRSHGVTLPNNLSPYFPEQADPGSTPATLVQVVPGGFSSASQSIRQLIDESEVRLDIMNPYLTDRDMIERIIAASQRGVAVRIVISKSSNNFLAASATKHRYGDLIDAGVEIYEYPSAVVHAKLIIADDNVHFGTVNLDAWALYRDLEIAVQADSPDAAAKFEERIFEPDIAASERAERASGFDRVTAWIADKVTYVL